VCELFAGFHRRSLELRTQLTFRFSYPFLRKIRAYLRDNVRVARRLEIRGYDILCIGLGRFSRRQAKPPGRP
jgi:hypothetical protein